MSTIGSLFYPTKCSSLYAAFDVFISVTRQSYDAGKRDLDNERNTPLNITTTLIIEQTYINHHVIIKHHPQTTGQMHSMKGAIKETVGGAIKSANLKQQGREEHQLGNAEVREAKANRDHPGTTGNAGSHGHSGGAGPFSGNTLGQYDDHNSGNTLGGGAVGPGAPYNQTRTDDRNLEGQHGFGAGSTGAGMAEGLAATGGGAGVMGLGQGPAGYDGLSGNHMNTTQNPNLGFGHQDAGFADRQTKQDLKEWERNAF
ncbi:hypothetical protein CVT25_002786 [Psilocybe cyanescens]|uniref:CsbD-like domain-containing protein n=1 Tax=Psilocybe cyanescens TaxID=93625 RepID=A0A409VYN2_PSICY|nr:hypothetical protein CVT25_002786 [Psilocybe cyanescens]